MLCFVCYIYCVLSLLLCSHYLYYWITVSLYFLYDCCLCWCLYKGSRERENTMMDVTLSIIASKYTFSYVFPFILTDYAVNLEAVRSANLEQDSLHCSNHLHCTIAQLGT